jgi:hypothetical protein
VEMGEKRKMNRDFHYYGTYVAACYAGYSKEEAQIIAHAAQYVDDSVCERLINNEDYDIDFHLIPTCHTFTELGWAMSGFIGPTSSELRQVWVPFHFLPGNYKSQTLPDPNYSSRIINYQGPTSWFHPFWNYEDHKWEFMLLCLPDSPISTEMINNIITIHKGQPYELYLTGIRMHVLADTAAHTYYAGTKAWHVNDVDYDVYYITENGSWQKVPFVYFRTVKDRETCVPKSVNSESVFYLGHGRMGHIPDYPWIKYRYVPKWFEESPKKEIVKDNPETYLKIFMKMVTALKCIKEGKNFDVNDLAPINQKYIFVIDNILRTKHDFGLGDYATKFRCELWKKAISDKLLGPKVTMPEEYNPDIWLDIAKLKKPIDKATHYYIFNNAAAVHLEFVKTCLENDGISLDPK